mmetsp:Transcript_110827/g.277406  ORF Transcript_110827/g.277406 Transcript_110827/m.277406 type:complete len:210 (+) Transcript_110827:89-718(+)
MGNQMDVATTTDVLTCRRTAPCSSRRPVLPEPCKSGDSPAKLPPGAGAGGSRPLPYDGGGDPGHVASGLYKSSRRRGTFEVWLLRTGLQWNTLGILASADEGSDTLIVDEVRGPSLISTWNTSHPEALNVKPGDRISLVNDVIGAEAMLKEIKDQRPGSFLRLVVEPADDSDKDYSVLNAIACDAGLEGNLLPNGKCGVPGSWLCSCGR